MYAIWKNRITEREARIIRAGDFPVMVLHGRHDLLAACRFGEKLARRCAIRSSGMPAAERSLDRFANALKTEAVFA